ncbi:MAG: xerD 1 [Gemmataceae bacterium]|nr:xerD 1 [Gemmataceae bacterium]
MAHLVRPWIVRWIDPATGKRAKKGSAGAVSKQERARKWYGVGIPGYGKKRVPLAKNKDAATRELDNLVRSAEQGQAGVPDPDAARRRLVDHLDGFEQALTLGLAARGKRKKKTPDPKQVKLTVQRVRDMVEGCGFVHVGDLNDTAPGKLATYLTARAKKPRKEGGISHQTAAFYLAAAGRFVWWLSVKKRARVSAVLFDEIPGFDPNNNRLHARRNITQEELAGVLESARAGPIAEGLTGEARYFLYLVAFGTGFRAGELASLKPEDFDLAAEKPSVRLSGKIAKNRNAVAYQPLPPGVAFQLGDYLRGKPKGKPLWPGKWVRLGAKMLRVDLAAAGVPYVTDGANGKEYADFHALRHSFVSALAAADVGPKVLQELARHSTPTLTLGRYTHTNKEQLAGAVARLPGVGTPENPTLTREQLEVALLFFATVAGCVLPLGSATGGATGAIIAPN